jgi:type IV pilus assembly protein PilB
MTNRIAQHILSLKLGSLEDLKRAESLSQSERISFLQAVEKLAFIKEDVLLEALSKFFRAPICNLREMDIPRDIIDLVPKELAIKNRIIPIDRAGNNLIVAIADPTNVNVLNELRFSIGFFPKPVLASEGQITEALEKYLNKKLDIKKIDLKAEESKHNAPPPPSSTKDRLDISANDKGEGPIIKIVNQILMQCLTRKASDIHIEPYEHSMRVRLRIDGVLHEIARPPLNMKAALTSRIKIMSKLKIDETRLPQDGAINISIESKPVDFRVSTIPCLHGEKIVMRILDKSALQTDMTKLGFEEDELKKFNDSINSPFGMVLVTGPTGSGKTTTLYSALAELNKETDNIMTAEDPVEFNLEGINQVGMKADIGLNFASALRAFLRQDPDVIMVGEIRDPETAEIAIKAALTGHMVLSTLHTNSATDTITRLLQMGVQPFNLVSSLTCVTAQRLVRKICTQCRIEDTSVSSKFLTELGVPEQFASKITVYKGKGCPACSNSGNKGRIAIHEVLKLNDPVKEAIVAGESSLKIKKIAMQNGMRSLRQSALTKMSRGICDVSEVIKMTAADSDEPSQAA